ncbi:hypothetical protein DFH11DRAFT_861241 [Phellopilus nigrolimitatus]|nr:hypothetical protein DFH11DRAFT_861241 [Phellopilus nigrolimitatus]
MDIEDDAELPRKRRIPNPPAPSATLASSSGTTLVASRFFAGSAPAPSPTRASSTGGGSTSSTIRVLSHMLSPARGEPIDLEDSSIEDLGPEPVPSPAPVRSAAASGKQKQPAPAPPPARGKGGVLAAGGSFDEFDFGSDGDIDADFLAEVERAEQAALGKMQAQARETSRPKLQTSGSTRTPAPARTPVSRPQASQSQSQSKPRTQSQRAPTQPKPIPQDVITIEDEDEDDKENVPVPKRRVRRRISTMPDDVIDLSD